MKGIKALFVGFLAPWTLIAIAGLQIYRAQVFDQSPWKGGGFGMFSTVDSPGARYVRLFVVTSEGLDLEVPMPAEAAKELGRVRVIPTSSTLQQIAKSGAAQTWLWAAYDPTAKLLRQSVAFDLPGHAELPVRPVDQPRLRARRPGEPDPPLLAVVEVAEVRAELWKLRYRGGDHRLSTRRILTSTAVPIGMPAAGGSNSPRREEKAHVASR